MNPVASTPNVRELDHHALLCLTSTAPLAIKSLTLTQQTDSRPEQCNRIRPAAGPKHKQSRSSFPKSPQRGCKNLEVESPPPAVSIGIGISM